MTAPFCGRCADVDVLVFALDDGLQRHAISAASALRSGSSSGLAVDLQLEPRKPKWGFKHADRIGAGFVALIGQEEAESGSVRVKNLKSGKQETVALEALAAWVEQSRREEQDNPQ